MRKKIKIFFLLSSLFLLLHVGGCATTSFEHQTLNLKGFSKEHFVNNYFKNKKLNKVEGIWRWLNGNYTIAVIKNDTGTLPEYEYLGIVIKGKMIKPGVVKLKINKTASSNVYSGVYVKFNLAFPGPGMDEETTFLMTGPNIIETAVSQIGKVAMIRTYPPYDENKEKVLDALVGGKDVTKRRLEQIDFSICTLEFETRRESYYWLLNALKLFKPCVYEMSRLNIEYVVLSKRRLIKLVDMKYVRGWDDPRMPTMAGMRRRGVPPHRALVPGARH